MEYCYKFDSLHLHIDGPSQRIIVDKCCIKGFEEKNWIEAYSFDDFNKLENVYNELDKLKNIYPTTFNNEVANVCPVGMTCCDFSSYNCQKLKSIEVALDTHCNARCRFCGIYDGHTRHLQESGRFSELEDIYFKTLNSLKGHQLFQIRLTDTGEPFFYKKRTLEFLQSLTQNDVQHIAITSNFTTILPEELDETLSVLEKNGIFLDSVISLNGWDINSYASIMGINGDLFYRVLKNIEVLNQHSNIYYQVSFVIDDEAAIPYIYQFCKQNKDTFQHVIVSADSNKPYLWSSIYKYFTCDNKNNFLPKEA